MGQLSPLLRCAADTAALPYNAFGDHLVLPEVALEAAAADASRSVPGRKTLVKHKMAFHRARIRQARTPGQLPPQLPPCRQQSRPSCSRKIHTLARHKTLVKHRAVPSSGCCPAGSSPDRAAAPDSPPQPLSHKAAGYTA